MPASIFESSANLPFGQVSVTIGGNSYLIQEDGMPLYADPRIISRTNSKGTVADVIVALPGEPNQGTITVQREVTTTPVPTRGTAFSADLKSIGVTLDYIIANVDITRSTDAMDTLTLTLIQTDNLRGRPNYPGDNAY
jgi:hypothetical protein